MALSDLIIASLGIWRLSTFVTSPAYSGPWGVLDRFRSIIGISYNETSEMVGSNVFAESMTCMVCAPIWLGALWTMAYGLFPEVAVYVILPFAVSAFASLIETHV